MTVERLERQLAFIREIDKSKRVLRQTLLMDGSRRENDAEHAWHLAVMALVLAEHAKTPKLDLSRVVAMLLVHDLVEIDAGDTFAYDEVGAQDKAEREQRAADRLFALLPDDQGADLRSLWEEFEARATPEARFAASLDRLQPLMHNFATEGAAWRAHGVTADRVLARNRHVEEGSPALWALAQRIIAESVARGYLAPAPGAEPAR
ncbi:MAG TPA: HD domain-containing protein [Limnochordia bacterium]|nr:HD domain-containing protein [Limnochordia bacterium]